MTKKEVKRLCKFCQEELEEDDDLICGYHWLEE